MQVDLVSAKPLRSRRLCDDQTVSFERLAVETPSPQRQHAAIPTQKLFGARMSKNLYGPKLTLVVSVLFLKVTIVVASTPAGCYVCRNGEKEIAPQRGAMYCRSIELSLDWSTSEERKEVLAPRWGA